MQNPKIIKLKKSSKSEDNNITNRWFDPNYHIHKRYKYLTVTIIQASLEQLSSSLNLYMLLKNRTGSTSIIMEHSDLGVKHPIIEECTFDLILNAGTPNVEYTFRLLFS
jgi:hypothetical protein